MEAVAAANFDDVGYKTGPLMAGKVLGSAGNYCRILDTGQVPLIGWWVYTQAYFGTLDEEGEGLPCLVCSGWENNQVGVGANFARKTKKLKHTQLQRFYIFLKWLQQQQKI